MAVYYSNELLSEKWLKASVVGSIWAVVEIVFGSMLHNLKIPLSGSILSVITVYLIISFFQLWKVDGMIWRSGLICALMKSLSPSAILLGPMIGIFLEAVILEVSIRIFGKSVFAYAFGGALAVFSVLVQKAFSLLILYGWDIVILLNNMYLYATHQLRIEGVAPTQLLITISGIYLIIGLLAAILGYQSGKHYLLNASIRRTQLIKRQVSNQLFLYSTKKNHSVPSLFMLLILLIAGMLIISNNSLLFSSVFTIAFTSVIAFRYRQNMRFLKKAALWIQLSFILLFSAVFYDGFSINGIFQPDGWIIGLKMVFRAMVLMAAFSAISSELKNPVVKNVLYKKGMKSLYQALELAFSALPGLMETFPSDHTQLRGFRKFTLAMLNSSESLLENFLSIERSRPTIFVISGNIHEGKTTLTQKVVKLLQEKSVLVRGFFAVAYDNVADKKLYCIEDIETANRKILCSENPSTGDIKYGRFYFSAEGIQLGRDILFRAVSDSGQLIVIDEIGSLEINDNGWAPAIRELLNQTQTAHLWIVREKLTNVIIRKWNVGDVYLFKLNEDTPQDIAACIFDNIIFSSFENQACMQKVVDKDGINSL